MTADLYDNVSGSLRCNDIGHGLRVGRSGYRLRWYVGEPESELGWNLHSDSDQLGQWLHEYCDCAREPDSNASRCKCNGWTADMHNNVSGSLGIVQHHNRLQLGGSGYRLRWYNGESESELIRHIHGDGDELCNWLYEHGDCVGE